MLFCNTLNLIVLQGPIYGCSVGGAAGKQNVTKKMLVVFK